MIVVGLDTSTPSTVAGVLLPSGRVAEARDDPPPGARPAHASRLLALCEQALAEAGVEWAGVDRLAVGAGPGGFTGLRIGVATARGLAQAHGIALVPVSSLRALALGAAAASEGVIVAVIDARRGEAFAAGWAPDGAEVLAPAAYAPDALAALVAARPGALCAGDGAIRFRAELERAGAAVPPDGSPAHRIGALQLCRLGAEGEPVRRDAVLPDYRREPDAKPPGRP